MEIRGKKRWFAAALLGYALTGPDAQARQMGGIGITVYQDAGYRGENATFRDNQPDLRRARFANNISSLQVTPGEVWEVCAGINYGQPCQIFSGQEPSLERRRWNDRILSLRRVRNGPSTTPGRPGLILYSNERFGGEARPIAGLTASLGAFNDRAKSVRVLSGRWELCEDDQFRKCRNIDRDWPNLESIGLASRVSSVRPLQGRGGDPGTPGPPAVRRRLVLYDRDRYRGEARTFEAAANGLGGFGNRSQSAQVTGTWQLCDRPNFAGRCVTISQDVPNLGSYGMNGRVSSARPLGITRR